MKLIASLVKRQLIQLADTKNKADYPKERRPERGIVYVGEVGEDSAQVWSHISGPFLVKFRPFSFVSE